MSNLLLLGLDGEFSCLSELHTHHTDIQTFKQPVRTDVYLNLFLDTDESFESLPVFWRVENGAIRSPTSEVKRDFLASLNIRALHTLIYKLFCDSPVVGQEDHFSYLLSSRACVYHHLFVFIEFIFD